jgi:hypothetical protein
MAVIKRYQLLRVMQHMTWFDVNGKTIPVSFQGGTRRPYLVRGRFSTSDQELQRVMESDNGLGKVYFLEHTDYSEGDTPPEEVSVKKSKDKGKNLIPDQPKEDAPRIVTDQPPVDNATDQPPAENKPPDETDYPEVKTVKEARQKLIDLFPEEFKPAQLPNKASVLNKAAGKKITFSNLD